MLMLAELNQVIDDYELAIKNLDLDSAVHLDKSFKSKFSTYINSLPNVEEYAEIKVLESRYINLMANTSELKNTTLKQLAQFKKNKAILKKYKNV